MANFQIKKNIENQPIVKISKTQKGKEKKNFLENREVVKGFQIDITEKNNEEYFHRTDDQQDEKGSETYLDDLALKIEKAWNESERKCEVEEEFPVDLLYNDEYRKDIWQHLINLEKTFPKAKPNYMLKQKEIDWSSRAILVDWLACVAEEYELCDETFHLAINYIDRYLSATAVIRHKLQLVGVVAMMLASKMEEYYSMSAKNLAFLTDNTYTVKQILRMERVMLKVLNFKVQAPTICGFIQHLCTEYKMEEEIRHLAMYISELILLDVKKYLAIDCSQLAAGAIIVARYIFFKSDIWPEPLQAASGYSVKKLRSVISKQLQTLKEPPMDKLEAIKNKYGTEKYNRVSMCKIRI